MSSVEKLLINIQNLNTEKNILEKKIKIIENDIKLMKKQLDIECKHIMIKDTSYTGHETEWICKICGL